MSDRKLRLFGCALCEQVVDHLGPMTRQILADAFQVADGLLDLDIARARSPERFWRGRDVGNSLVSDPIAAVAWCLSERLQGELPLHRLEGLVSSRTAAQLLRCIAGNPFARERSWTSHRCPQCGQEERWLHRSSDDAPGSWPWCPECNVEMKHRFLLWRSWRQGLLVSMAGEVYQGRLWQEMPALADGLRDAGCQDTAILDHLASICPRCGGSGRQNLTAGVWNEWPRGLPCPDCQGRGLVLGLHARGCWVLDLLLDKE